MGKRCALVPGDERRRVSGYRMQAPVSHWPNLRGASRYELHGKDAFRFLVDLANIGFAVTIVGL